MLRAVAQAFFSDAWFKGQELNTVSVKIFFICAYLKKILFSGRHRVARAICP